MAAAMRTSTDAPEPGVADVGREQAELVGQAARGGHAAQDEGFVAHRQLGVPVARLEQGGEILVAVAAHPARLELERAQHRGHVLVVGDLAPARAEAHADLHRILLEVGVLEVGDHPVLEGQADEVVLRCGLAPGDAAAAAELAVGPFDLGLGGGLFQRRAGLALGPGRLDDGRVERRGGDHARGRARRRTSRG